MNFVKFVASEMGAADFIFCPAPPIIDIENREYVYAKRKFAFFLQGGSIMSGINGINAYQQAANAWQIESKSSKGADNSRASETKAGGKNWAPIESGSSLIPKKTEYGMTVGDVKLSDKAKDYYEKLKAKYHNMEFIAVSKDMKDTVAKHAANYGNAGKAVVLIDEEKLERMATDEDFRKKYEGIISMGQQKLAEAKNSLASSGAKLLNFGMKVEDNGKVSFFATVEKSQEAQKARIEKKQEAKREAKAKEKKKAAKEEREERIEEAREERQEAREGVTFRADNVEDLLTKLQNYVYEHGGIRTEEELLVGSAIDFKG